MSSDPLIHAAERLEAAAAAARRAAYEEPPGLRPTPFFNGHTIVEPTGLPPPDAEGLGSGLGPRLPASFWEERKYLARIRAAAWCRQRSPDAVLGAVLARVAASVPHDLGLPPIVGAEAGLSMLVAVVAWPGYGKTTPPGPRGQS